MNHIPASYKASYAAWDADLFGDNFCVKQFHCPLHTASVNDNFVDWIHLAPDEIKKKSLLDVLLRFKIYNIGREMNIKFGKMQIDYCDRRGKPVCQLLSKPCSVCCGPFFASGEKSRGGLVETVLINLGVSQRENL